MKNRIIKALPQKEYRLVMAQLKPVELTQGAVLYEEANESGMFIFRGGDGLLSLRDGRRRNSRGLRDR
jgi:hypothetical protein